MKSLLKIVLLIAALASIAIAADRPNFSGDWKLNAAKSNFGPIPAPATYTRKVTQAEPSITIEDTQTGTALGDQHDTRTYSTDGKEISYQANGADVKATMTWDGDALNINAKASIQGMELTITDKVTLGDDGKTMTDAIHIETGQGGFDLTLVFDKQ
jgi:opacity protein-like surface antigen